MLANYLTTAIRSLRRNPGSAVINIAGLAIGLAGFLLIMLFVRDELSYDRFHEKADRVYRINRVETLEGVDPEHLAITSGMIGPTLETEIPEVEASVRVMRWFDPMPMTVGETALKIDDVLFADPSFFDVFSFDLISGDPLTALEEPQTVVLTEPLAERLFDHPSPIGETLVGLNGYVYTVTGIIDEPPGSSHLRYEALISWSSTVPGKGDLQFDWANRWMTSSMYTFVLLRDGADAEEFARKLPGLLERNYPDGAERSSLYPQALTDIHLESNHIQYQNGADLGNRTYVRIFALSALLILLIACINFVNVTTAVAGDRSREVGVRKALGAAGRQLRYQFLGESVLTALVAFVLAVSLVEMTLPSAEAVVGKELNTGLVGDPAAVAVALVFVIVVGVVAGLYPALVVSSFQPVAALRGTGTVPGSRHAGGAALRRILVAAQFAISTILLAGSVVVIQQTEFMRSADVGIDTDQVVILPISDTRIPEHAEAFKSSVLDYPGVIDAGFSDWVPGESGATYTIVPEGRPEDENWIVQTVRLGDFDFIRTYGIEMASGRFFDARYPTDSTRGIVINETLARSLGWGAEGAIGKRLDLPGDVDEGRVIGVVEDFNLRSVEHAITPVVFIHQPSLGNLSVRVSSENVAGTIAHLESVWQRFETRYPVEYRFLDETFGAMYASQVRLGMVLTVFAILAVLVACLGLFGLASLLARKRTKEIGIRKVMGASVAGIVGLLTGEIVRLILIATMVAIPVAIVLLNYWLDGFAYRIDLSPTVFAGVAVVLLAVGLLAVGFQSIRAALANPVEALRYE